MIGKNGREIPNQFIVKTGLNTEVERYINMYNCEYYQSYNSIIVLRGKRYDNGQIMTYLDINYWDYSNTTRKYRNLFLGETTKETKGKIESGEYKLVDLNK